MRVLKETLTVMSLSVLLPLVKLVIVLAGLAETAGWVWLGCCALSRYRQQGQAVVFLWPVVATVAIYFQLTLWHYYWLKFAQGSNRGRALGEYFCSALRYPIARRPHSWE